MSTYGSVDGVAAYVGHMTNAAGTFDNLGPPPVGTAPSLAQVEEMLDQVSAEITGWLARASYVVPVTQADAKAVLDRYANVGAAGLAELSQRVAGTSDDESRRENQFLREFRRCQEFIDSGALGALGVPQARAQAPLFGLSAGGYGGDGQALKPIFTRTSFGNDPYKESTREP